VTNIKLLADMNISPVTVNNLQIQAWDIIRVVEILPPTASDLEILEFARQEERVILSHDLDFSMLLAVGGYNRPSLITLRLSFTDPEVVTEKILNALPQIEETLNEGAAVTIEDDNIRIRKLPIK
jgi:predicted nuclease of predicted toxin-antitoxin system